MSIAKPSELPKIEYFCEIFTEKINFRDIVN